MIFGDYDLSSYASTKDIKYVKVYQETGFWAVLISDIKVNLNKIESLAYVAIVDTGSSLIDIPEYDLFILIWKIRSFGECWKEFEYLICDCGVNYHINDYPSVSFTLGSEHSFKLDSTDYFLKQSDLCLLLFANSPYQDVWILGDVFIRKYYTIFDAEESRLGFALSINSVEKDNKGINTFN